MSSLHENTAKDELLARLRGGTLRSVTERCNWMSSSGLVVDNFELLTPAIWALNPVPTHYDRVWQTGTRTMIGRLGGSQNNVECFGIRFEPTGIAAVLVACGVVPVEAPPPSVEQSSIPNTASVAEIARDRRPLPNAKLESWAAIFNEFNPGASEAQARTAFDATFSRHSVTVRELRRVLPQRRPGRPLKVPEE